jgi:hypothetical protein
VTSLNLLHLASRWRFGLGLGIGWGSKLDPIQVGMSCHPFLTQWCTEMWKITWEVGATTIVNGQALGPHQGHDSLQNRTTMRVTPLFRELKINIYKDRTGKPAEDPDNTALFQDENLSNIFSVLFKDFMSGPMSEGGNGSPHLTHSSIIVLKTSRRSVYSHTSS